VSERPRRAALNALAALILLEGVALAALAIYLVVEIFLAPTASVASAIALAVCAVIAAIGLAVLSRAVLRGRPWIRGATICWQVLQVLVAVSILQAKAPSSPLIGGVLIVPAVVIVALLFTPTVVAWTSRSRES
jgi:hypothetical protein